MSAIEHQPWLERPDWAAGRVVHDPVSGGFLSYVMIVICLLIVAMLVWLMTIQGAIAALVVLVGILLAAAIALMVMRFRTRQGVSECLLLSVPARIGGALEADVKARLGNLRPNARVRATLSNGYPLTRENAASQGMRTDAELAKDVMVGIGRPYYLRVTWNAERHLEPGQIQRDTKGLWTIPVRIPIPSAVRATEVGPVWVLHVTMETAGPDYGAHFEVPVFDLGDRPVEAIADRAAGKDASQLEKARILAEFPPVSASRLFRSSDLAWGVLVGTLLAFAGGFSLAETGPQPRALKGFFGPVLLGTIFVFGSFEPWRSAVAAAFRRLDLPDEAQFARFQLALLRLAPWVLAALVLWVALNVKLVTLFGAFAWGIGMMVCARRSPFGRFWRDPLFHAGVALPVCSVLLA